MSEQKHYSRRELLAKLRLDDKRTPQLGFPTKPKNLPRTVSREWVETARKLHGYGVLWSWQHDAEVILRYVSESNPVRKEAIIRDEFSTRVPFEEPSTTLERRRNNAAFWSNITTDDLNRLRLTPAEAQALAEWRQQTEKVGNVVVSVAAPVVSTPVSEPGIPQLPEGLTPVQSAMWKGCAISVLFGASEEIAEACREDGGANFLLDQIIRNLPRLQAGKGVQV